MPVYYYRFNYLVPTGELTGGHVLASTDDEATFKVQAYLTSVGIDPGNYQDLQVVCPADLQHLMAASLWNLQSLSLPEMLGILQAGKEECDAALEEVSKMVPPVRPMRARPVRKSADAGLSIRDFYDHIDDKDCHVIDQSISRTRPDKNAVLTQALSPLWNW
jgi:hypothetical protein